MIEFQAGIKRALIR